jgi:hypothetical protein
MRYHDIQLTGSLKVTGSITVPLYGADGDYPNANTGSMYHNTTDGNLKVYTGNEWEVVGEQIEAPAGPASADIEYLVVAGGGGGGGTIAGGGGAGGYLSSSLSSIESGSSITVTVGSGGTGGYGWTLKTPATNGGDSTLVSAGGTSFTTVTATGGGYGGDHEGDDASSNRPGSGGSGGGGGRYPSYTGQGGSGTVGQGNDGGDQPNGTVADNSGAGGGGAGAAGDDNSSSYDADGGIGKQSNITGTLTYYAGGGGAGTRGAATSDFGEGGSGGGGNGGNSNTNSVSGTANTGGGGGGGGYTSPVSTKTGGDGGSGVVILAYPSSSVNAAGGIVGDAGNGRKYHQFNTTGTFELGDSNDFDLPKQDNLQLLWRADDYSSRGTSTWTDISGNSRNGTVSGATLNNNTYYSFDGSNDQIYDSDYYRSSGAQTLAIWIKFAGNGYNGYSLSGWQEGGSYNYMGRINTGTNLYYYMGNGTGGTVSYSLSNDTWYLLTNTVDSSGNHNLYVDTTSRASNSSINMGSGGSVPLRIGALGNSANYFHNGDIGIVAVWDTHLTSTEVAQLYNATKTNFT